MTSMQGTQQLMNQLEAHAVEHPSAEEAAAAGVSERPGETDALHMMLRSPIAHKNVTHKEVDPALGLTASGRARCVRKIVKEKIYLQLGGAPRLSHKLREAIEDKSPPPPATLPVRSNLEQEQEQARFERMPLARPVAIWQANAQRVHGRLQLDRCLSHFPQICGRWPTGCGR